MPNISDADRRLAAEMLAKEGKKGGRTISDADRRLAEMLAKESAAERFSRLFEGKELSDADRQLLMKKYINRNDGGIARKTRTF
jgi:hypothetical protein|tara:strand:+ start:447 stop:698 length:252 start_codon:yes stop_codon:yes gene_type:complete